MGRAEANPLWRNTLSTPVSCKSQERIPVKFEETSHHKQESVKSTNRTRPSDILKSLQSEYNYLMCSRKKKKKQKGEMSKTMKGQLKTQRSLEIQQFKFKVQ